MRSGAGIRCRRRRIVEELVGEEGGHVDGVLLLNRGRLEPVHEPHRKRDHRDKVLAGIVVVTRRPTGNRPARSGSKQNEQKGGRGRRGGSWVVDL